MGRRFRIGVDLGGTKIEGAAMDRFGAVQFRHRVATPAGDYRATVEAINGLVRTIERRSAKRHLSASGYRGQFPQPPASSRTPIRLA